MPCLTNASRSVRSVKATPANRLCNASSPGGTFSSARDRRRQQIFDQLRRGEPDGILPLTLAPATKIFLIGQGTQQPVLDVGELGLTVVKALPRRRGRRLRIGDRLFHHIRSALSRHWKYAPISGPLRERTRPQGVSPAAQPKGEKQQHDTEEQGVGSQQPSQRQCPSNRPEDRQNTPDHRNGACERHQPSAVGGIYRAPRPEYEAPEE